MVFRNIEVDFDIYDADTAEVYEGAVQTVLESAVPKEEHLRGANRFPTVSAVSAILCSRSSTRCSVTASTRSCSVSAPT